MLVGLDGLYKEISRGLVVLETRPRGLMTPLWLVGPILEETTQENLCPILTEPTHVKLCQIFDGYTTHLPIRLYARPQKGGWGILEMNVQVKGHKKPMLASTVTDTRDWYTNYLRMKLVHYMARMMKRRQETDIVKAKDLRSAGFFRQKNRSILLEFVLDVHGKRSFISKLGKAPCEDAGPPMKQAGQY